MKKIMLVFIAFLLLQNWSSAQSDVWYATRNATLTLNGEWNGQPLRVLTPHLNVRLDYETAEIIIRFPVSSLETDSDTLQKVLKRSPVEVVFEGKLGLEYVNTENHPPLKFETEGWLTIGKTRRLVRGSGELHHIGDSTEYACTLGMKMTLNARELGIPLPEGMEESFEAIIKQALLQKDKN